MRTVISLVAAAAMTAGACAHQQSIEDAARAACVDQGVQPGPEMDACIEENEETIRRAREYRTPPPPRPSGRPR